MKRYLLALLSPKQLNNKRAEAISSVLNSWEDVLLIVDKRTIDLIKSLGMLRKDFRGEIIVFEKRANEEKVLEILSSYTIEGAFICVEEGKLELFAEIIDAMNIQKTRC